MPSLDIYSGINGHKVEDNEIVTVLAYGLVHAFESRDRKTRALSDQHEP